MRRSYYELYIHVVWSTKNTLPLITESVEKNIQDIVKAKCRKFDTELIAIGNVEDHIHLLLSINPNIKISELVGEIKGATSYFINRQNSGSLHWQDGYGALSVSKSALKAVKKYIENQKEHHKLGANLKDSLEERTYKEE